jgi:type IX secretion system PorP/SprF family membrane protein
MLYNNKFNAILFTCFSYFFVGIHVGSSQTDPNFSQTILNPSVFNSGYVGSNNAINFIGMYRSQWTGIDGAPETYSFTMDTPLGIESENHMGLGLTFLSDRIGAVDESFVTVDFSYTLKMNETLKLGFGVKGGGSMYKVDFSKLNIYDPNDGVLYNTNNKIYPVFGVGAFLYEDKTWYLGLSSPNILETSYFENASSSNASKKSTFYLMGGYVFDLNEDLQLKPAMLTKMVIGAPLAIQLSSSVRYMGKFDIGIGYQFNAELSTLAGFQINDNIYAGYAYDLNTGGLRGYNGSSHGIILKYNIPLLFEMTRLGNKPEKLRFF